MKISHRQYKAARERMGVSNYALRKIIGTSLRQAQRYESGETAVPSTVARLLFMLWRFGVPVELQGASVAHGKAKGAKRGDPG